MSLDVIQKAPYRYQQTEPVVANSVGRTAARIGLLVQGDADSSY